MSRRRKRVDVIPWSFCGTALPVPVPETGFFDCIHPLNLQFPVVDGGAFDTILKAAAVADLMGDTGAYYDTQGVTRGLSFLGAEFWLRLSLIDTPTHFITGPLVAEIRIMAGLVRLQWTRDETVVGGRTGGQPPNLFSRDEQDVQDVLYRWPIGLGPIIVMNGADPNFVDANFFVDSTGGLANYVQTTDLTTPFTQEVQLGSGISNQTHHRVRGRRFLDEQHYVALCFSISVPFTQDDQFAIGLESQGVMKIAAR